MTVERKNRVKDRTATAGTVSLTIDLVAPVGFLPFSAHTNGATVHYTIVNGSGTEWEVGEGVWTSPMLTRDTIYASSNSGNKVSFGGGYKTVFTGPVAADFVASSGGVTWAVKTSAYDAAAGDYLLCNTTSAAFSITLPASPATADAVTVKSGPSASTNALTIARNGNTIMSLSEDMTISTNNTEVTFVYDGTTWRL